MPVTDAKYDEFGPWSFEEDRIVGRPDAVALSAGQKLWEARKSKVRSLTADEAEVEVRDGTDTWLVNVWLSNGQTYFECTCPEGRNFARNICRHKVAAALELAAQFERQEAGLAGWRAMLNLMVDAPAPRSRREGELIGFALVTERREWGIVPVSISMEALGEVDLADTEALRGVLGRSPVAKRARFFAHGVDPSRFINNNESATLLCRLLSMKDALGRTAYVRKGPQLGDMLPLLRHCLTFLGSGTSTLKDVLTVPPEPITAGIRIEKSDAGLRLIPRLTISDELLPPGTPLTIISDDPSWLLGESTLFELAEPSPPVDMLMEAGPDFVTIPSEDAELFYRDYLPRLTERAPVDVQNVTWIEIDTDPVPRIYLDDENGELRIRLKFAYDGHELGVDIPSTGVSVVKSEAAGVTTLARIHRKREREEAHWSNLLQHGLKAGGDRATFSLRARVEPLDFLIHHIPRLLEAGFEVYGQEELKSIRVNRNRPKLEFFVSSGIDWFDVNASATFGDVELPLSALYEAIRRRDKFVKLADGSIGAIPPEWLERYRHLFALGEKKDNAIRVSARQQLLIDDALSQADEAEVDAVYQQRRETLRGFENIAPHPLPAGFVGELRPYQKAGYDWLHFLHEYEFGGCLADDMGIGKTVQTLAFLQSLKESTSAAPSGGGEEEQGADWPSMRSDGPSPTENASLRTPSTGKVANLIVMPRSLLFNWEREAAKFTPGLKVLVHAENRTKKAVHFERYDLVLTTYGILLRDIEMLRKYRFHYAILDESQAIKNPLSQTGRAARLLNSDHRLTLTGTPVENSTVELWSQFAFLNPGMLGGLDYFRDEFAAAIERGQDPDSAQLLKKMVFPFILRRTKDQVAPELPPRTERILFAEMEADQQAFYDKTKERYRAELLSLIDQQGVNNSRMKVLEALLRLRQIANHPKLVDPESTAGSAKFDLLIETLGTVCSENHKALVFSQFVSMLGLVRAELDSQNVPYAYLDGRTRNRQEKVDEFQSREDLPLFLISLKAGGVGLNLTAADYVVHIDPWWNPAVERQATDRTHRIGQDKPVFVYKLITRGTVEEKILELQDRKRALADTLISTEESFFKSLTAEDVAVLLE